MDKSQFEKVPDGEMFYIIKIMLKEYNDEDFDLDNSDFIDACDNAAKLTGTKNLEFPIDYNYIISFYLLNSGFNWDSKRPEEKLKRPVGVEYSFDYDEHRTEFVRRTYRHYVTTYDENLIMETVNAIDNSPDGFEYYNGNEIDADYYDGETTDSSLDRSSITKVKKF